MLVGSYQHNIDSKNRVIIPAKFREELGEVFYAMKGTDGSIVILSKQDCDDMVAKICALPASKAKDLKRYTFASTYELVPDKQGRVVIHQTLKEHAQLDKDVIIIGTGTRAEIWDLERWNSYNSRMSEEQMLEVMSMFDL